MKRYANICLGTKKATLHNAKHNDRTKTPSYVLSRNISHFWCDVNSKDVEKSLKNLLINISKKRKELGKKKISSQTHVMKEFVVNLNSQHRPQVMHDLEDYIKRYGFIVLQKSIHFDEGVFVQKLNFLAKNWDLNNYSYDSDRKKWLNKNGKVVYDIIVYQPDVDIFWDEKSEKWYYDREFKLVFDMTKVKRKINFHGHILVLNLDKEGNSIARTLRPYLSQIQKDIAHITVMPIKPNTSRKKRKGQGHMDYKNSAAISAKEDEVKRRNIVLYNENQILLKEFYKLNPQIPKIKNLKDKQVLIENSVEDYLTWKIFAIYQYKLLGFDYEEGQTITIKSAEMIKKKLAEEKRFIEEVFKTFGISKGTALPEAVAKLKSKLTKTESSHIKSLL